MNGRVTALLTLFFLSLDFGVDEAFLHPRPLPRLFDWLLGFDCEVSFCGVSRLCALDHHNFLKFCFLDKLALMIRAVAGCRVTR